MPESLPLHPNLDHLRRQAKDLLRAYQAGDASARQRIARNVPQPVGAVASLAQAQFVLAREYGFASWVKLKLHVEAVAEAQAAAARGLADKDRSERRLERHKRVQA